MACVMIVTIQITIAKTYRPSTYVGFPGGSAGKESTRKSGRPGLERSTGERNGYPLQYFGMENSLDCMVHGVPKNQTRLSDFHRHSMCACVLSHFSCVWLYVTLWTVTHQASLSMGILQARILEWVAISPSRRSSPPRDLTHVPYVSCIGRWVLYLSSHSYQRHSCILLYFCWILVPDYHIREIEHILEETKISKTKWCI